MNLALIDTDDPKQRAQITDAIYHTELTVDSTSLEGQTATRPIALAEFQRDLSDSDLVVEYVVAEPQSQALAITKTTVRPVYTAGQATLEADASRYRHELRAQGVDPALGQKLFNELLGPIDRAAREVPSDSDSRWLAASASILSVGRPQPVSSADARSQRDAVVHCSSHPENTGA